jgi:hypothetical protein
VNTPVIGRAAGAIAARQRVEEEREMRKIMLVAAALALGAVGTASAGEMKVTGIVTKADEQSKQITVGDKSFDMSDQAGTAMFPQVGGKVTLSYEERDGKNVVTRIGQAQQ